MYVDLARPLAPGETTVFDLAYSFNIPEHGADRMGREGSLYEIAQWYPRMAVYDDVHGWNTDQYLGQGEFYLEYGDIDYEVTLPAGYIVAGTGGLQNPDQVLTPTQRSRLATALKSDSTVAIITPDELASGAARPRRDGTVTWRFRAERVRDVAWAASPDYRWDASGWDGTLAQAYYRNDARDTWEDAAKMSRYSILEYSTRWFRYPYPQISAIEGPVSGMEYPMVAMTPADRMRTNQNWREALYNKPAVGLVLLREHITSPDRFDPVFREYIRRWSFKHPTPADFFRTMEDGLGEDLSWFWHSWFYTTDRLDQAVDSVAVADSAGILSRVYLRNVGEMPMPVELALTMDDGSAQRIRLPVEIWGLRNSYTALVAGPKKVTGVVIDPDGWYPDVDRSNNRWPPAPAAGAPASASTGAPPAGTTK